MSINKCQHLCTIFSNFFRLSFFAVGDFAAMFDKSPQFQYEDIQLIQVRAFPVAHAIP